MLQEGMFVKIAGATYNLPDAGDHGGHAAMLHVLRTLWEHYDQAMGVEAMRTVPGPAALNLDSRITIIEGLGEEMMPDEFF